MIMNQSIARNVCVWKVYLNEALDATKPCRLTLLIVDLAMSRIVGTGAKQFDFDHSWFLLVWE